MDAIKQDVIAATLLKEASTAPPRELDQVPEA